MKISIKQYSQTLLELTEDKSQDEILVVIKKFAEQLKGDGQLKNVSKIMEKFSEIYNAKNGIVVAEVTISSELSDKQVSEISNFVKEKYSAKEVEMKIVVDKKIQGGIIIRVNDEVLDGSISAQLKKLQKELVK